MNDKQDRKTVKITLQPWKGEGNINDLSLQGFSAVASRLKQTEVELNAFFFDWTENEDIVKQVKEVVRHENISVPTKRNNVISYVSPNATEEDDCEGFVNTVRDNAYKFVIRYIAHSMSLAPVNVTIEHVTEGTLKEKFGAHIAEVTIQDYVPQYDENGNVYAYDLY